MHWRIGEAKNPGPPDWGCAKVASWNAEQIQLGQKKVAVEDCQGEIQLPCKIPGGCRKHRDLWAQNSQKRYAIASQGDDLTPPDIGFGDKEQVIAPDRLKIVLQNIQSFDSVGSNALVENATVHVWPEANVMARGRDIARKVLAEAARGVHFSIPMDARCATGNNNANLEYNADRQCRLAITVAKPTDAVTLAIEEGCTRALLDSGRWVEVLVPIDDGKKHIVVAGFYGISGASNDASQYKLKEQLIQWAILRMLSFSNTPYVIAGDFNIDPEASEVIQQAIADGKVVDTFQEWEKDKENLHPTFCRAGVFQGMAGTKKTRIDTILANQNANAMVHSISFDWDLGRKYDHARLVLEMEVGVAKQKVQRLTPVVPICVEDFAFDPPEKAKPEDILRYKDLAEASFTAHWKLFDDKFREQIKKKDINGAHETWCSAAEIWLF